MRQRIRLTESDLHRIIKESVKIIAKKQPNRRLNENFGEGGAFYEVDYGNWLNVLKDAYGLVEDALLKVQTFLYKLEDANEPHDSSYNKMVSGLYQKLRNCLSSIEDLGKGEDGMYNFDRSGRTPIYGTTW